MNFKYIYKLSIQTLRHAIAERLRHCATSRKVADSRPDGVTDLAALGPGVYSVPSRNEYQKQKNRVSGGQRVGLDNYPPPLSRLSIQCGTLNISQPYTAPQPVTGIAQFYFIHPNFENVTCFYLCMFCNVTHNQCNYYVRNNNNNRLE
jgi:hypothetical protein